MTTWSGGRDDASTDRLDDRALLAAHLAGDADAFGTLFSRHRDRLWAVALRTCENREDAADALQDAMVSAFRRADSYRGDAAVSTWLHRIVVNACLDALRRRKVRLADSLPDDVHEHDVRAPGDSPGGRATAAPDPAEAVLSSEHRTAVLAALQALPPEQKVALVLVDMYGYSVQEVAAVLECPPGTVKSRCARGRSRLVPLLESLVDGPAGTGPPASRNQERRSRVRTSDRTGQTNEAESVARRPAEEGSPGDA